MAGQPGERPERSYADLLGEALEASRPAPGGVIGTGQERGSREGSETVVPASRAPRRTFPARVPVTAPPTAPPARLPLVPSRAAKSRYARLRDRALFEVHAPVGVPAWLLAVLPAGGGLFVWLIR